MRKFRHHQYGYYLLGKLLQGLLVLVYVFFTVCLLLTIVVNADIGWMFLMVGGPWVLKLVLTFGCGVGLLSLFEALS